MTRRHSRYPPGVSQWLPLAGCRVDLRTGGIHRPAAAPTPADRLSPTELDLVRWLAARPHEDHPRARLLREVWGYSDRVVSRTVDTTLRRLRRKLEADPGRPRHFHTARGVGYRFEPHGSPPSSTPRAVPPAGLPAPLTPFVGQVHALERVHALLQDRRLVTILGPGGVGKTRLALAAATAAAPGFSTVCFWPLSAVHDADGLRASLHTALGVSVEAPPHAAGHALAACPRPLLVVDNAEHLGDLVARRLAVLLRDTPALVVLATSRAPLGLRGEARFSLPPLSPSDARRLLSERAADVGTTIDDPHLVERLVDRLDRLPLAIELAAARLDTLQPDDLLHQLDDRFRLLSADWPDAEPRQATLWAAIDWSWSRLTEAEQDALAALARVRATVPVAGAEALIGRPDARALLDSLQRTSLLQADGSWRSLLESVGDFARAQRPEPDPHRTRRWAAWLVERAEACQTELDSPRHAAARSWLGRLRPELLAIGALPDRVGADLAVRALLSLHPLLHRHAALDAARARYTEALALPLSAPVACDLSLALADVQSWHPGATESALRLARAAVELAEAHGDLRRASRAHGVVLHLTSAAADRAHHAERTLSLARAAGGRCVARALLDHGVWLHRCNQTDAALAHLEEALALCADRPRTHARLLRRIAPVYARRGRRPEGIACGRQAIALYAELEDPAELGWAHNELGIIYLERSDHTPARECFERALAALRATGAAALSAVQTNLAAVHHQEKDLAPARRLYTAALVEIEASGRPFEQALTHANLGNLELDAGAFDAARAHLDTALEVAATLDAGWLTSLAAASRASLHLLHGELDEAEAIGQRGVAEAERGGWPRLLAYNLAQVGLLEMVRGKPEAAHIALARAADAIARHGDPTVCALVALRQGALAWHTGRADDAADPFARAAEDPHLHTAIALWRGGSASPRSHEERLAVRFRARPA